MCWFDGKGVTSILKVKGSNPTNVFMVNSGKLTKLSPMKLLKVGVLIRLITLLMYLG